MRAAVGGPTLSRWRPSPRRAVMLVTGLWIFGTGEGLLVLTGLGNSPWAVFAQGLGRLMGLSVGMVTNLVGALLLVLWFPLRQRPGLGTIANVALLGTAMDVLLDVVPAPANVVVRVLVTLAGIALVGLGSGLYLGAALGPGPRDGLMTGLHRVTGFSLVVVRWGIEISVLVVGIVLGGTFGVGTVAFALLVGPTVALFVRVFSLVPSSEL